jgi:predicted DNA-binding protein (UPF0251 family)
VSGTVTLVLRSPRNASPFWIMLLLVWARLDNAMIPSWQPKGGCQVQHGVMRCRRRLAALHRGRHSCGMRLSRAQDPTADLFWQAGVQEPCRTSARQTSAQRPASIVSKTAISSPRYVLPGDLYAALQQLGDLELDRLHAATRHELQRRARPDILESRPAVPSDARSSEPSIATKEPLEPRQPAELNVALTRGQMNAVRASFKAGITPSRIARQFGISQSDVRKVLASELRAPGRRR